MAKRRDWRLSVQYQQFSLTVYELKWWHPYPETLGWVCLEIGARLRLEWIGEKISKLGQWAYQKSDKAEIPILKVDITDEQARKIDSDFVEIFD